MKVAEVVIDENIHDHVFQVMEEQLVEVDSKK
jgi:hypothetical protein